VILPHEDLENMQIAIHYESKGRCKDEKGKLNLDLILERAGPDIDYLCQHYFGHPNYLRIDGKPVLVFYLSRNMEKAGLMRETSATMQNAARKCGEDGLFLIGDHAFQGNFIPLDYLDAITNYDVHGSTPTTNGYALQDGVDHYFVQQQEWRDQAHQQGVHYAPVANPGFNNRASTSPNAPLSRKLDPTLPLGSLFRELLRQAVEMVDMAAGNLLFVNSWNEWHEDTQIEPALQETSFTEPFNLTQGMAYEGYAGYATLYLDLLREMTTVTDE